MGEGAYCNDVEPWEYEALDWLRENPNRNALAHNHFRSTQEAIEAVRTLYSAGAVEVRVGPVRDDPDTVQRMGGPYADLLTISFPPNRRKEILAIARSLHPDDVDGLRRSVWYDHDKGVAWVRLWWD